MNGKTVMRLLAIVTKQLSDPDGGYHCSDRDKQFDQYAMICKYHILYTSNYNQFNIV